MTDWNKIDYDSRSLICDLLSATSLSSKASGISCSEGCCVWDISCVLNGKTTSVEVKGRSFESTRYGDVFAEKVKQDCTQANYSFQKSLAVNVFTDNVIAIADLYDKRAKHFSRWCPRTTLVEEDDHSYVLKETLSLPQTVKVKFQRMPDGSVVFSKAQ